MSKLKYNLKITPIYEDINQIYGMFEHSTEHIGGITIKFQSRTYQGDVSHWIPKEYSLADLTKDYAKQGRENPSKEAYESLQKELEHYLEGYTLHLQAQIFLDDVLLAEDSIGTDYSHHYYDSEEECAKQCANDNFDIRSLIREARENAKTIINKLEEVA